MPTQLPYIICTAVLILLNVGPLVWQFKQGNSGPIAMGVWIMVGSIHELINTTVWYGDAIDRAPIWCDISVKVAIGQQIGRVASVYCIARFLADIVSPRATAITRGDRRRRAIHDYSISFGLPAVLMAGSALYQPYRYRIVHGLGCTVPASQCWPVLALRVIWSPVFAVGGMLYSAYTVYRLILHRRDLRRVVAGAHSALTTTRFMRLTALCVAYLCIGIPLAFFSAYEYINTGGNYADYSWTYMRSGWDIYGIPTSETLAVADFSNWSNVVVASLFFAVFGFGGESSAALRKVGNMVWRPQMKTGRLEAAERRTAATNFRTSKLGRFIPGLMTSSEKSHPSENIAPLYEIGREVGFSRGIKVVVEEEQDIV